MGLYLTFILIVPVIFVMMAAAAMAFMAFFVVMVMATAMFAMSFFMVMVMAAAAIVAFAIAIVPAATIMVGFHRVEDIVEGVVEGVEIRLDLLFAFEDLHLDLPVIYLVFPED